MKLNIKVLKKTIEKFKGTNATKEDVQKYYISECERLKNEKEKR